MGGGDWSNGAEQRRDGRYGRSAAGLSAYIVVRGGWPLSRNHCHHSACSFFVPEHPTSASGAVQVLDYPVIVCLLVVAMLLLGARLKWFWLRVLCVLE
jgi:hypothetical protein